MGLIDVRKGPRVSSGVRIREGQGPRGSATERTIRRDNGVRIREGQGPRGSGPALFCVAVLVPRRGGAAVALPGGRGVVGGAATLTRPSATLSRGERERRVACCARWAACPRGSPRAPIWVRAAKRNRRQIRDNRCLRLPGLLSADPHQGFWGRFRAVRDSNKGAGAAPLTIFDKSVDSEKCGKVPHTSGRRCALFLAPRAGLGGGREEGRSRRFAAILKGPCDGGTGYTVFRGTGEERSSASARRIPRIQPRSVLRWGLDRNRTWSFATFVAHTPTIFPELLTELRLSVLITTYQTGHLVVVAAGQGRLVLSFHQFERAMGIAVKPGTIAVCTRKEVWFARDAPDIAAKLEPRGHHDACFLARTAHFTDDIQAHEAGWVGGEFWVVNTLFSCLAAIHPAYSFAPAGGRPLCRPCAPRIGAI